LHRHALLLLRGDLGFGALPPLRWCHRCAVFAVRGKYAMTNSSGMNLDSFSWPAKRASIRDDTSKSRQIHPRFWHQGRQPGDEVQWLKDNVRRAIAVRCLELGRSCASIRPRHL
jgi:hypothetical protein